MLQPRLGSTSVLLLHVKYRSRDKSHSGMIFDGTLLSSDWSIRSKRRPHWLTRDYKSNGLLVSIWELVQLDLRFSFLPVVGWRSWLIDVVVQLWSLLTLWHDNCSNKSSIKRLLSRQLFVETKEESRYEMNKLVSQLSTAVLRSTNCLSHRKTVQKLTDGGI